MKLDGIKFQDVKYYKKLLKEQGCKNIKVEPSTKYKNEFVITCE